MRVAKKM